MAAEDYSKLTVAQIRDLMRKRGISAKNLTRKQQLIERLQDADAAVEAAAAQPEDSKDEETGAVVEAAVTQPEADKGNEPVAEQEEADAAVEAAATQPEADKGNEPAAEQEETGAAAQPGDNERTVEGGAPPALLLEDDSKKRKRRSPTPPPSTEAIAHTTKRMKQDGSKAQSELDNEHGVSGGPAAADDGDSDVEMSEDISSSQGQAAPVPEQTDDANKPNNSDEKPDPSNIQPEVVPKEDLETRDKEFQAAIHPATEAIYVRNFKRPIQIEALKRHLRQVCQATSGTVSSNAEQQNPLLVFHLDSIRTHCFAVFPDISSASRARSAMHRSTWPDNQSTSEREPLFADFVPEEKVSEWIKEEEEGNGRGGSNGISSRWEIEYTTKDDGSVIASLEQIGRPKAVEPITDPAKLALPKEAPIERLGPSGAVFCFTKHKPKINWRPVSRELAEKRRVEKYAPSRHFSNQGSTDNRRGGDEMSEDERRWGRGFNGGDGRGYGRGGGPRGGRGRGGYGEGYGRGGHGGSHGRGGEERGPMRAYERDESYRRW